MGRPPIRVSLHLLLLLLLLLRRVLVLLLLLLLLLLLGWMLRVSVRMRGLSDVSGYVSAVRVRANRHFHVIVFIGRSRGAGGAWRLIGGVVTASMSAAHRAHARASRAGGDGGGGGGQSGAVTRVRGRSRVVGRAHGLMMMVAPTVRRRIFVRTSVGNV